MKIEQQSPRGLSLRGRLVFLLKDSVIYGGASAATAALGLIVFPILARHFSVTEYGVVDFFLVLAGLMAIFLVFGQDSAIARFFYEYEDAWSRRQVISQSLALQLVMAVVLLPVMWLGAEAATGLMISAENAEWLFKLIILQLPFVILASFARNILKWTFSRGRFLIMSVGFVGTKAVLLVFAVEVLDVGVEGVLIAGLIASVAFGFLGLYFVRGWLTVPEGFAYLRELIPFAIPYGIICTLGAFAPALERGLIDYLLSGESLGLYAAAAKVAMLVGLGVSAFQTAWGPFSLSLYKQKDAGQTYNLVLKSFTLGICLIVLMLALAAKSVLEIFATNRYSSGAVLVFPLAMGLAIQSIGWITDIGIGISKRTHLSLLSHIVLLIGTVGGILHFVPILGLLGAGIGILLGQLARAVLASWLAQRTHPYPWEYGPVMMVLLLTLAVGGVALWSKTVLGDSAYSPILAMGALGVFLAGWLMLFDAKQRTHIISFIARGSV